ncbi:Rne/Rng family ribonuclease [Gorillibacterium timonense]|uniref:Rne/Rng family ribonuclease n=1 Tax=Gorillibacterium timonense TaxID=1689269 RepID=UPI00071DFEE4|nr:Rne/Rng family ribonuclease [Gorillibacterium timonense]
MNKLVVEWDKGISRVALVEDGRLSEFYLEGPEEKERAGNVFKGRIVNVLPGMDAAFVDIGQSRNAFLYRDDLLPPHHDGTDGRKPGIEQLVRIGQDILVQIKKEAQEGKGARVTTRFTIPGRALVYMPDADYTAVSRRIGSSEEKQRLKAVGDRLRRDGDGIILRTAAEGISEDRLEREWGLLRNLWRTALAKAKPLTAPCLVYRDLDLIPRLVRDLFTDRVDELVLDNASLAQHIIALLRTMAPELASKIVIHREKRPLFEAYPIHRELEHALRRKIPLASGGYLIFDKTEAMTVIDVNTGGFTGHADLEETVFRTNLEAAEEIPRLLRLRDSGGMILVDFIDMKLEEHRQAVKSKLEESAKHDRGKLQLLGWTRLGLFELTRRKRRQGLETLFYEACSTCEGTGRIYIGRAEAAPSSS